MPRLALACLVLLLPLRSALAQEPVVSFSVTGTYCSYTYQGPESGLAADMQAFFSKAPCNTGCGGVGVSTNTATRQVCWSWTSCGSACRPYAVISCANNAACDDGNACTGTETCVVGKCQAGTPLQCDDGDTCNGQETCAKALGCVAGTPLACDDGKSCTADTCQAATGCGNTFTDAGCTCTPPPVTTAASSFDGKVSLGSRACPSVVGGTLGASITWSGSAQGQLATCANGCAASLKASGTAGAAFSLCSGALSATGTASLDKASVSDLTCAEATCGSGCGGPACQTLKASSSFDLKFSRFYGYQRAEKLPGMDVKTRCGGTLSAGASLAGRVDSTSATAQGAPSSGCPTCVKDSLSLTGSAGAAVDCSVDFGTSSFRRSIGCKKCLSLDTKLTGAVGASPSGCASGACKSARADATLGVTLPGLDVSYRWWKIRAACSGSASACSELNSCGACSCGGAACVASTSTFSCTVCGSGPLTAGLKACL